jgi:hypothetical protein
MYCMSSLNPLLSLYILYPYLLERSVIHDNIPFIFLERSIIYDNLGSMDLLMRQDFDISAWDAKHVVSYFS